MTQMTIARAYSWTGFSFRRVVSADVLFYNQKYRSLSLFQLKLDFFQINY